MVEGQVFKSYRDMCLYMGEDVKSGNAKAAQMRKWGCLFSWHKEGNKIVVDDVYPDGKVRSFVGGNNRKHVKVFKQYVKERMAYVDFKEDYVGTQRLMSDVLGLIDKSFFDQVNGKGKDMGVFYAEHELESMGCFEEYLRAACSVIKDTTVKCLRELQDEGVLEFSEGYMFVVEGNRRRYACTDEFNEFIVDVERKVCDNIGSKMGFKVKGRQVLHLVRGNHGIMRNFWGRCREGVIQNKELIASLNEYYKLRYMKEIDPNLISRYYKAVHFVFIDEELIGFNTSDKGKLYDDIKPRIKKLVNIPEKDLKKLEDLLFTVRN